MPKWMAHSITMRIASELPLMSGCPDQEDMTSRSASETRPSSSESKNSSSAPTSQDLSHPSPDYFLWYSSSRRTSVVVVVDDVCPFLSCARSIGIGIGWSVGSTSVGMLPLEDSDSGECEEPLLSSSVVDLLSIRVVALRSTVGSVSGITSLRCPEGDAKARKLEQHWKIRKSKLTYRGN